MVRSRPRLAAVLTVAALVLAACGGGDDDSGGSASGSSNEIKVFAAASLTAAFTKLGEQYSGANGGTKVTFNFAGSQALATQIQQAAPADVFASADIPNMDKVKELVGTPQNFASNLLQIVVENGNPKGVKTLDDLASPDLKVVLAAEEVPAGKYAKQILDKAGISVSPVSQENNVKAVVTKVSLGEADAGIVYVTDVTPEVRERLAEVEIPGDVNVVATYPIAVVSTSQHASLASDFVSYVSGSNGESVLRSFGFMPPV
jgi:molybdate transport system substrate-binding protein